jgi:hypothetical protein
MPFAVADLVKTIPVVVDNGSGLATTIIAVLGVVLALASLAWQAVSFRLTGSRVSVYLRGGMKHMSGVSAVTTPGPVTPGQIKMLQNQGFTVPVLAVEVKNSGRSPTNIVNIALLFGSGASYSETVFDPPLPFRLDAESEQTWYFDRGQIETYAKGLGQIFTSGNPLSIRGGATIGGKTAPVRSKNRITV